MTDDTKMEDVRDRQDPAVEDPNNAAAVQDRRQLAHLRHAPPEMVALWLKTHNAPAFKCRGCDELFVYAQTAGVWVCRYCRYEFDVAGAMLLTEHTVDILLKFYDALEKVLPQPEENASGGSEAAESSEKASFWARLRGRSQS